MNHAAITGRMPHAAGRAAVVAKASAAKLSRADRRALKRYNEATGADKSADERFAGLSRPTSTHRRAA